MINIPGLTKWPVSIIVIEKRADGYNFSNVKAKRVIKKNGETEYKLSNGIRTSPIKFQHMYAGNKVMVYSPNAREYYPIKLNLEKKTGKLVKKKIEKEYEVDEVDKKTGKIRKVKKTKTVEVEVEELDPELKTVDEDVKFWVSMEMRRANEKFSKVPLLERIAPLLTILAVGLSIMLIYREALGNLAQMTASMQPIADSLSEVARAMKEVAQTTPKPAF